MLNSYSFFCNVVHNIQVIKSNFVKEREKKTFYGNTFHKKVLGARLVVYFMIYTVFSLRYELHKVYSAFQKIFRSHLFSFKMKLLLLVDTYVLFLEKYGNIWHQQGRDQCIFCDEILKLYTNGIR